MYNVTLSKRLSMILLDTLLLDSAVGIIYIFTQYLFRDPNCLCLDNIEGFILNVPAEYKLGFVLLPLKRRHWIALKKIHGAFYNLDSKLDSPQFIGKVNYQFIFVHY